MVSKWWSWASRQDFSLLYDATPVCGIGTRPAGVRQAHGQGCVAEGAITHGGKRREGKKIHLTPHF